MERLEYLIASYMQAAGADQIKQSHTPSLLLIARMFLTTEI